MTTFRFKPDREFERRHISRSLDSYRRVFSKKITQKVEAYLAKLRVELMLAINKLPIRKLKKYGEGLEDYMFEFEDDFEKHLDLHIQQIKCKLELKVSNSTDSSVIGLEKNTDANACETELERKNNGGFFSSNSKNSHAKSKQATPIENEPLRDDQYQK